MNGSYLILDIEVCPINFEEYKKLVEEEKLKLLNPIDSKIIALGMRFDGENKVFIGEDEKEILEAFWEEWRKVKEKTNQFEIVGFNLSNFDLPFLTARSFIHNVKISPFVLKSVVDLRDKINAYRYGKTRGKLNEFAGLMGIKVESIEGREVPDAWFKGEKESVKQHLEEDLKITDEVYKRAKNTNILHINKW